MECVLLRLGLGGCVAADLLTAAVAGWVACCVAEVAALGDVVFLSMLLCLSIIFCSSVSCCLCFSLSAVSSASRWRSYNTGPWWSNETGNTWNNKNLFKSDVHVMYLLPIVVLIDGFIVYQHYGTYFIWSFFVIISSSMTVEAKIYQKAAITFAFLISGVYSVILAYKFKVQCKFNTIHMFFSSY